MKKLYKIVFNHIGPKDNEEGIKGWIIADSDKTALDYVCSKYSEEWIDRDEDDGLTDIYDDEYNVIGQEQYLVRMLRLRGEYNDPNASYDDAYYGITHYGWSEAIEIPDELAESLIKYGIATDILNSRK